jgi:hypothetical protein
MGFVIEQLTPATFVDHEDDLVDILVDCVHDGASVGFLAPLGRDEARARALGNGALDGSAFYHKLLS